MGTSDSQVDELLRKEDWAAEWVEDGMFRNEQPQHKVFLPAFEIAAQPVTNEEYYTFTWTTGSLTPRYWTNFQAPPGKEKHPVVGISKDDALAYSKWLSQETGVELRLPTEAEWEKAARGQDDRLYPWGNEFNTWRCNTVENNRSDTTPIGTYSPSGDSPWGVSDLSGNVFEWTSSFKQAYPYRPENDRQNANAGGLCVVRGGAWYYSRRLARCSSREYVMSTFVSPALGFRLARTVK